VRWRLLRGGAIASAPLAFIVSEATAARGEKK